MPGQKRERESHDGVQQKKEKPVNVEKIQKEEGEKTHMTTTPFPSSVACFKALTKHFKFMTEIQMQCIPHLLEGKDVQGQAKTGSGKTLAFMLPAVEVAIKNKSIAKPSVLIIEPVRELTLQTQELAIKLLENHKDVKVGTYTGKGKAHTKLSDKHIAITTPGAFATQVAAGELSLDNIKYVVLDEVDHLLDMGFYKFIQQINEHLPKKHQRALFSATMKPRVAELGQLNADHVSVSTVDENQSLANDSCDQYYVVTPVKQLLGTVLTLLRECVKPNTATIVFFPTNTEAIFFQEWAQVHGLEGHTFTGRLSPPQRVAVFKQFREKGGLIFTSSLAARGLDFPLVSTVLQIGAPTTPTEYIHRIGRTGRMNAVGRSIIVLTKEFHLGVINWLNNSKMVPKEMKISPVTPVPSAQKVDEKTRHQGYIGCLKSIGRHKVMKKDFNTELKVFAREVYFSKDTAELDASKLSLKPEQVEPFMPPESERKPQETLEEKLEKEEKRKAKKEKKKEMKEQEKKAKETKGAGEKVEAKKEGKKVDAKKDNNNKEQKKDQPKGQKQGGHQQKKQKTK